MNTGKSHILSEIRRLAEASGKPPGVRLFERETGIKESDWYPVLWLRWGDALQEAGFTRNTMQEAFSDEFLVEHYARLAQRLARLPVRGDRRSRWRRGILAQTLRREAWGGRVVQSGSGGRASFQTMEANRLMLSKQA